MERPAGIYAPALAACTGAQENEVGKPLLLQFRIATHATWITYAGTPFLGLFSSLLPRSLDDRVSPSTILRGTRPVPVMWGCLPFATLVGKVKTISVRGGNPVLVEAAETALYKWKWSPSKQDTHEVIEIRFNSR
jgi:hypothetical protein